jgi:hypothetical protein
MNKAHREEEGGEDEKERAEEAKPSVPRLRRRRSIRLISAIEEAGWIATVLLLLPVLALELLFASCIIVAGR